MNAKDLSTALVGFIVAILVTITILVPIVTSGLTVAGDPITLTNDGTDFKEAEPGDVIEYTRTIGSGNVITYNGGVVPFASEWDDLLISDSVYIRKTNVTSSNMGRVYEFNNADPMDPHFIPNPTTSATLTVEFTETTIEISVVSDGVAGDPSSIPYEWAYIPCTPTASEYIFSQIGYESTGYVKYGQEPILCGAYDTGELDTLYYYNNGESYVSNTGMVMSVSNSYTLTEGTTDIYDLSVSCTITDGESSETFTPYRFLIPSEVEGHKDSGVTYTLISIIPIFVVIGLLIGIVTWMISNRRT